MRSLAIIQLENGISISAGPAIIVGNRRRGALVGAAIGLLGNTVGLVDTAIGLVGTAIGLVGTRIGLVGTRIGLMGAAIGLTGALVGNFGFTITGESSIGALTGLVLIGMMRMEPSFAMAALKKKRAATVIVSWSLKKVFMINVKLQNDVL